MQGLKGTIHNVIGLSVRTTCAAAAALASLHAAPAHAFGPGNDYCVRHNFRLETQGNVAPEVRFKYKCKTQARTNTCKDKSNISGTATIGAGVTSFWTFALAPGSWADAESLASVNVLQAGLVSGTIEVNGNADPTWQGCPPPFDAGYGYAKASSTAKLSARGQKIDRRGRIKYSGSWKNTPQISGSAEGRRALVRDPIVARLFDYTTGDIQEWTLMSLMVSSDAGEVKWDEGVVGNTSSNMSFDLVIDSPVTVQSGRLKIEVENGIVTEIVALGLFSSTPLQAGDPGTFSFALPELDLEYDLGGDETHDLVPEFDFDNGGETEKEDAAIQANGSCLTDLGTGFDDGDVSQLQNDDSLLGMFTGAGLLHIADDFHMTTPGMLHTLMVPAYVPMSDPFGEVFGPSFVRLWRGAPWQGGTPIAINPAAQTVSDITDIYRVGENIDDHTNLIRYVVIDMSWAPELMPGEYWAEIGLRTNNQTNSAFAVPSVWRGPNDNAMVYMQQNNQWMPAFDSGSQRPLALPLRVFGDTEQAPPCPADVNGDGLVNVSDLLAVINAWGQPGGPADINGDGIVNVSDLLAVINAWGQCPSGFTGGGDDTSGGGGESMLESSRTSTR